MAENKTPELDHLLRIEKFMASITDLDGLLALIIREATKATHATSCSLALYDQASDELYFYFAGGDQNERDYETKLKRIRMPMGQGIVGLCARTQQILNIPDAYQDPRFDQSADKNTGFVTRSILAVPMVRRDKLIGVVESVNRIGRQEFTDHDQQMLTILAAQAALIIENARLYEENLRQARLSALGQGIAGAAHCIKNILNGIDGGSFILDVGLKRNNPEKIDQGWDMVKRNTRFLKELVLDMLTYSRPRPPEKSPSDINAVCADVAELIKDKAKAKNVTIVMNCQPGIPPVKFDPKGIFRCLLNLGGNAVDACGAGGQVTITTGHSLQPAQLQISIADNGCGISPENQANLFKAFFSTKGNKGTGLGLAVTHKIITEHGGTITVDSRVGEGTRFLIALPAAG